MIAASRKNIYVLTRDVLWLCPQTGIMCICVVNKLCVLSNRLKMPPRSKAWLHFSKTYANRARCNISKKVIVAKAGNTTNLMKRLTMHGINSRTESCSVFDCKKSGTQPSSSQHLSPPVDVTEPKKPVSKYPAPDSKYQS